MVRFCSFYIKTLGMLYSFRKQRKNYFSSLFRFFFSHVWQLFEYAVTITKCTCSYSAFPPILPKWRITIVCSSLVGAPKKKTVYLCFAHFREGKRGFIRHPEMAAWGFNSSRPDKPSQNKYFQFPNFTNILCWQYAVITHWFLFGHLLDVYQGSWTFVLLFCAQFRSS